MSVFVTYRGRNRRSPERVLRIVRPTGTTYHVIVVEDEAKARELADRLPRAQLHEDRESAVADALGRWSRR